MAYEHSAGDIQGFEEGNQVCCDPFGCVVAEWTGCVGFTVAGTGGDDYSVTCIDEKRDLIAPTVPELITSVSSKQLLKEGCTSENPWTSTIGGLVFDPDGD